jgi:hypothetical protein
MLYDWVHSHAYSGGWGWTAEDDPSLYGGMRSLRTFADVAVIRLPHAGLPDTCNCSDAPPSPQYTCQQQQGWGKCGEDFMKGYCCRSCHSCSPTCGASAGAHSGAHSSALTALSIDAAHRTLAFTQQQHHAPWKPNWPHADYRHAVALAQAHAQSKQRQQQVQAV